MIDRDVFLDFHVDANRINARSELPHMNILEQWRERGVISIAMSGVAQQEAAHGDKAMKEKSYIYGATETLARTSSEIKLLKQLQKLLFPQGIKKQGQWNDAEVVFNAHKYFAILITDDGDSRRQPDGILGRVKQLRKLGIQVLRDHEAVKLVKQKILARDQIAEELSSTLGEALPDWVGKDLDVLEMYL